MIEESASVWHSRLGGLDFWNDPRRWDGIARPNLRDPASIAFWTVQRGEPAEVPASQIIGGYYSNLPGAVQYIRPKTNAQHLLRELHTVPPDEREAALVAYQQMRYDEERARIVSEWWKSTLPDTQGRGEQ